MLTHTQLVNISDVLPCPSPSQYFVGREDTLRQLTKVFFLPIVSIWSENLNTLGNFVRQKTSTVRYIPCLTEIMAHSSQLHSKSLVFLDASSGQALEKSYADIIKDRGFSRECFLVLENADPSLVLEDYLPTPFGVPILVTSTNSAIGNWTLHADCSFHLSECADFKAVNDLVGSIEKSFTPGQHVTTLVANGGSGKTQVVLRFVAENSSR